MPDRDKVIKGFECCVIQRFKCHNCTYGDTTTDLSECHDVLLKDALELLKEQEPVKPIIKTQELNGEIIKYYGCGICKTPLPKTFRFCQMCGRKVKWDDSDRNGNG